MKVPRRGSSRLGGARGFTLLEAIVAMVIFSMGAFALYGWLSTNTITLQRIIDRRQAAELRTGGLDRIVVAHADSPAVADWESRGGTGAVAYVHETVACRPGTAPQVCEAVVGPATEDRDRFGMQLVGAFRTAMRADDEVIGIWSVPDWDSWAKFEAASDGGDVEFFHLYERLGETVTGRERILLVDAELSPLRTGRQPTAADRRPLDQV